MPSEKFLRLMEKKKAKDEIKKLDEVKEEYSEDKRQESEQIEEELEEIESEQEPEKIIVEPEPEEKLKEEEILKTPHVNIERQSVPTKEKKIRIRGNPKRGFNDRGLTPKEMLLYNTNEFVEVRVNIPLDVWQKLKEFDKYGNASRATRLILMGFFGMRSMEDYGEWRNENYGKDDRLMQQEDEK